MILGMTKQNLQMYRQIFSKARKGQQEIRGKRLTNFS